MKRSINTTNLTKAYIESKISQISIMSKYLNIPIETINECVNRGKLIKSVFRTDDNNNSMGFAFNKKGKLKVRDFGGVGFFEDVYGVVAYVLSNMYERPIECNRKQDFYFILKHIAYTFRDIIEGKEIDETLEDSIKVAINKGMNKKTVIEVVPRSWNNKDKQYWNSIGVSLNYLNTNFIYAVDQYYINRTVDTSPKYYYNDKDPCYAYMIGQNSSGIILMKLYFPKRNKQTELKFVTNCNVLEGLLNLELNNYDYIIITKSTKDRVSLGNTLFNNPYYRGTDNKLLNIGVINLPSENYHLKEKEYNYLKNKLADNGMIYSFLDFDRTGRRTAKYLKDYYNIPYIFITRGEFGLYDYGAKDFSELFLEYSKDEIVDLINETIYYVEQQRN